MKWLVPVEMTTWLGKSRRRTVPITGTMSEWQAQGLALLKCQWFRFCGNFVREYRIERYVAGHSINSETMKCCHGCCSLGQGNG